jgi:hypothetical protein
MGSWAHETKRTSVHNVDPSQVQMGKAGAPAPDVMAALCQ